MNIVVIVESSTKARTISKYLNKIDPKNKYNVVASNGHVCDVVKKNMGLDLKTFQPNYEIISDKKKTVANLKELSKSADLILLAADNDREGEAIAWHLKQILKPKRDKRIVFNEITPDALKNAINNPKDVDMHMVNAQQARRIMDRLVGFNLTKVLWNNFDAKTLLSAGRVQSVVLYIIVQKESKISSFVSEQYWTIYGNFTHDIEAKLYERETIHKFRNANDVVLVLKKLSKEEFYLKSNSLTTKEFKEYPDLPFTTSTLQQKATSIGFSIKQTMKIAQELYEHGHITYMRTDSTSISQQFKSQLKVYVEKEYGTQVLSEDTRKSKSQKNAQEAHEAIRPTKLVIPSSLSTDQLKLYMLIFHRTISYVMRPAVYKELNIKIHCKFLDNKKMYLLGKIRDIVYVGYKIVYGEIKITNNIEVVMNKKLNVKMLEATAKCTWSTPPSRYNEASIIKYMEETGIGRPTILNKLYERQVVNKQNVEGPMKTYEDYVLKNGSIKKHTNVKALFKDTSKLVPSETGITISEFLNKEFNDVVDIEFTSNMENNLDKIAHGEKTYIDIIKPFYTCITEKCKNIKNGSKIQLDSKEKIYNINNMTYKVRTARYGPVIECCDSKRFIDLKPYFKLVNTSIDDITEHDVKFLLSFPITFNDYGIDYKRYGFFAKKNEKTLTIYAKFIPMLREKDYAFLDSMFK